MRGVKVLFSASCEEPSQRWNIYKDDKALFKFVSSADAAACLEAGGGATGLQVGQLAARKSSCATGNEALQQVCPGMQNEPCLSLPVPDWP
jgi:hypothetical protein